MLSDDERRTLAQRLLSLNASGVELQQMHEEIRGGSGIALSRILFKEAAGEERWMTAKTLMTLAEWIMGRDVYSGTYLMVHLCEFAGRSIAHSVVDAIHLWMHQLSDPAAIAALELCADEPVRPRTRQLARQWVNGVLQNLGRER